jgi:Rrf2 family protein
VQTLSKRCRYGLRALYALTREYGRGPVPIAHIAAQENIPHKFLEAILLQLKNRGIVDSQKGKKGGYRLAARPEAITIGSIIRAIDGPLAPLPCASETAFRRCSECVDVHNCETRLVMKEVRDAIAAILDRRSLAQVCERNLKEGVLQYDI